ncbi:MAG: sigma-70 family RNA polymerase sigma factor [Phycisphaeraceae bacterium]|nr:sigma-70 family RNA polymerase sigma factor [Phycisphaeraceae bacterium]
MDFEDQLLVLTLNRGDKAALHRLYEKYKDSLVTLAGALLMDRSGAQDVVHDVFFSFMQQMAHFRLTGSLKGYLSTCVANHARNCNSSWRRRQAGQSDESDRENDGPVRKVLLDERAQQIAEALDKLPDDQREVVALRIYAGQRFPEIARHQGASVNTVEGRFRYAMAKLRKILHNEVF